MVKSLRSPRQRQLTALLVQTRQSRGLTQAAIAARLGKPQSFVAKVEGGERQAAGVQNAARPTNKVFRILARRRAAESVKWQFPVKQPV